MEKIDRMDLFFMFGLFMIFAGVFGCTVDVRISEVNKTLGNIEKRMVLATESIKISAEKHP